MNFIPRKGRVVGIEVSEPIEVYVWDGRRESYHTVLVPGRSKKTQTTNFVEWNSVRIASHALDDAELKLRKPIATK